MSVEQIREELEKEKEETDKLGEMVELIELIIGGKRWTKKINTAISA